MVIVRESYDGYEASYISLEHERIRILVKELIWSLHSQC